jgi:chaperonin GroEL (HSP60 family)
MQPKQYTDPKIALLNIELELKAERDNAEVRLENVEVINILAIMTLIKMFNDTSLS